jgi:FtsH-binding integral membrane protein
MIIASLVNMFIGSSTFDLILSFLGVLIFTGLTAYDSQKIKLMGQALEGQGEAASKGALIGALTLYLDFINLFLFILRLLGKRRE